MATSTNTVKLVIGQSILRYVLTKLKLIVILNRLRTKPLDIFSGAETNFNF